MSGIERAVLIPVQWPVYCPVTQSKRAEAITGVPAKVTGIVPADQSTNKQLDQIITWDRPAMVQTYDVWIGATAGTLVKVSAAQAARSYVPTLVLDSTYYLRIDSKNTFGTTTGDVTSFSTWSVNDILTDGDGVPVTDGNGEYIETPHA
jgi:hypothetical protein